MSPSKKEPQIPKYNKVNAKNKQKRLKRTGTSSKRRKLRKKWQMKTDLLDELLESAAHSFASLGAGFNEQHAMAFGETLAFVSGHLTRLRGAGCVDFVAHQHLHNVRLGWESLKLAEPVFQTRKRRPTGHVVHCTTRKNPTLLAAKLAWKAKGNSTRNFDDFADEIRKKQISESVFSNESHRCSERPNTYGHSLESLGRQKCLWPSG